jgi:hypothetical protein
VTNISSGAFANCSSIETMIVTGELVSGDTLASGVVDLYFTKGKQMKLPGATKTVVSLTLRDISSADYSPDDLDGKGGIGGSTERKLKLSDAKFVWNWALSKWESVYSVSGVLTVTGGSASAGGKTVSLIYLARIYDAVTEADGSYTIENVPKGAFGDITIAVGGYAQMATPSVTPLAADVTGNNITIVAVYTVIFTKGTGISEFAYIINGGFPIGYTESFSVKHGDSLRAIALPSEGYVFKTWSGYSGSSSNPLIVSAVSGDISLTASASQIPVPVPSSTSDTYYSITFSSGSYYTVYDTKGPVSSPITVTEGGSLTFRVQTSEGYSVSSPVISGNAKITPQTDGWYRISEIHSDIHVNVTVSAYSDSGEGPGEGSGDGDGSGNGSEENSGSRGSHSVLIIAVLLVCVLAIGIILFFLKRRKDDEEEDGR